MVRCTTVETGLLCVGVPEPLGGWVVRFPDGETAVELAGCVLGGPLATVRGGAALTALGAGPAVADRVAAARAAACNRCEAAVLMPAPVPPDASVAVEPGTGTGEAPWNETTALAMTNTIAAPATRDPAVPNPATYARVARISGSVVGIRHSEL